MVSTRIRCIMFLKNLAKLVMCFLGPCDHLQRRNNATSPPVPPSKSRSAQEAFERYQKTLKRHGKPLKPASLARILTGYIMIAVKNCDGEKEWGRCECSAFAREYLTLVLEDIEKGWNATMSRSVDVQIYEWTTLLDRLGQWAVKHNKAMNRDLVASVLEKCGDRIGDKYVLLNNEYSEEYNPFYNVATLVEAAVGIHPSDAELDDVFEVFLDMRSEHSKQAIHYVDKDKVIEELGLTRPKPSED